MIAIFLRIISALYFTSTGEALVFGVLCKQLYVNLVSYSVSFLSLLKKN